MPSGDNKMLDERAEIAYKPVNIPIVIEGGLGKRPAFFVGFLRTMRQTPLEIKISKIVKPVIEDLGYALVFVKIVGEAGGIMNVQIMAENPETKRLPIDACAAISRAISAVMDVEDPISGRYTLEVSSPGIDRPLTRLEDFVTYTGYEAKIESDMPAENGQRKFRGRLLGLDGEQIMIVTEQGEAKVPYSSLVKAKLVLTDELIKTTANL